MKHDVCVVLSLFLPQEGGVLDPSKQQLAQSGGASAQGMAKALQLTGTVAPSKSKGKAGKTAKGGEAGAAKEARQRRNVLCQTDMV